MKRFFISVICLLIMSGSVSAGNLYKISIGSTSEANLVNSTKFSPVYRLKDSYLIITETDNYLFLKSNLIDIELVAHDIEPDQIALDHHLHSDKVLVAEPIFQEDDLSLYRSGDQQMAVSSGRLVVLDNNHLKIEYRPSLTLNSNFSMSGIELDSLISLVVGDTLVTWLEKLEAFDGRLTGTESNYASADWIASKFTAMGYDSVYLDEFTGRQLYNQGDVPAANVVAVKVGTLFPDKQIVIGGHFDAVPGSPGADDNGTGTVGTMEIARILKNIETEMTFVFIAFDSEESGLIGSRHYANEAAARDNEIVYMLNMDMIAHLTNMYQANLFHGSETSFSELWMLLADSLVGINGQLSGTSGRSDHSSFAQVGYDVTFVHEYIFSTAYHKPYDSTTYINYDYMKRMIQASLATVYVVNNTPAPVRILSVQDVGDGQSLKINWKAGDPAQIDHYYLYYQADSDPQPESLLVSSDSSSYLISGLIEGQLYNFYLIAFDFDGGQSMSFDFVSARPQSIPTAPGSISALPLSSSIKLLWDDPDRALDFSHFRLFRDGLFLADIPDDTIYIDSDPLLGNDLHSYMVAAMDIDGNISDTSATEAVIMKAAVLEEGKILAINRSAGNTNSLVNSGITGQFMNEALSGTNYDYFSDSSSSNPNRAGLIDIIDYGIVIVASEGGRADELTLLSSNLLEDLSYYLSIGGKVILFGRWGNITASPRVDTSFYLPGAYNAAYSSDFNIALRIAPFSEVIVGNINILSSDFIGAHSLEAGYPNLVWDSIATEDHTGPIFDVSGIPSPSHSLLFGSGVDIIYSYDSRDDQSQTEGRPVGWRHIGGDKEYVYFEFPLSFMERSVAITALQKAVSDLGIVTDVDDGSPAMIPDKLILSQNRPNPFNPTTQIEYYNRATEHVTLEVFNVLGQRVRVLHDGPSQSGWHQIEWDGRSDSGNKVAAGIYLYRLKTENSTVSKKMILLK